MGFGFEPAGCCCVPAVSCSDRRSWFVQETYAQYLSLTIDGLSGSSSVCYQSCANLNGTRTLEAWYWPELEPPYPVPIWGVVHNNNEYRVQMGCQTGFGVFFLVIVLYIPTSCGWPLWYQTTRFESPVDLSDFSTSDFAINENRANCDVESASITVESV